MLTGYYMYIQTHQNQPADGALNCTVPENLGRVFTRREVKEINMINFRAWSLPLLKLLLYSHDF